MTQPKLCVYAVKRAQKEEYSDEVRQHRGLWLTREHLRPGNEDMAGMSNPEMMDNIAANKLAELYGEEKVEVYVLQLASEQQRGICRSSQRALFQSTRTVS